MYDSDLTAQPLGFSPVLSPKGEPDAVTVDERGWTWIQIRAEDAGRVALRIGEKEYPFERGEGGIWHLRYPVRDGFSYVQLLVDGREVLSPYLPVSYGYSRPYNCIMQEEEGEQFYRLLDVPHGTVRREYFFSSVTGGWESCLVYTPPGYDEEKGKKFPALYLQHGYGENETGWAYSGKMNFILDNLIALGEAVPFVTVMSNGMLQIVGEDGRRRVDHTLFPAFLMQDVIPFMENRYRLGAGRNCRALAGLSMGSIQACVTAFSYPEQFSCVGLFSGFLRDFIQGDQRMDAVSRGPSDNGHLRALDDAEAFREHFPVFFRGIGKEDAYLPYFLEEDGLLEEKKISGIRRLYDGAHDWNVWRRCLRDFARLIFDPGIAWGQEEKP